MDIYGLQAWEAVLMTCTYTPVEAPEVGNQADCDLPHTASSEIYLLTKHICT